MTQEQKRIKLAKAGGWVYDPQEEYPWQDPDPEGEGYYYPPDYFNDLNAVHELWLSLPRGTQLTVVGKLADMINLPKGDQDEIGELEEALFSATAAQRAEALGKTLSLWEAAQ